jgi:ketosteroid isomerase-like protein
LLWTSSEAVDSFAAACLKQTKINMKRLSSLLLCTLLAFAVAPRARAKDNPADSHAIKSKLTSMENDWEKALVAKDNAALANMLADDFYGINSKGKRANKSDTVDQLKTDTDTVSSATNKGMAVHIYAPNLASVTGMSIEKGKDKKGMAFSRTYAWADTWMERNGKWQCIAEGVSELPEKK